MVALGLCLSLSVASTAAANEAYSDYEQEALDIALEVHAGAIDPSPEGKRIVAIDIDVLDVIEQRDPLPDFLNIFHANTKDYVVRRELLFRQGNTYEQALVSETERNLRALRQESLVIIVPLQTERPDEVRVLAVVKDVWSLRLNSDYRFKNGQLEYLFLQPAEENLAGTHRRIFGAFSYEPDVLTFGGRAVDPRLAGSRHVAAIEGNVFVNHATGELEGSSGFFQYGKPLFSTRQQWSWGSVIQWNREITRLFRGTDIRGYDADATPGVDDAIPITYTSELIGGRYSVTRSFGIKIKHDLTIGVEGSRRNFRPENLDAYDPAAAAEFVTTQLPSSDTRNGPYLQYHLHFTDFASLLDVNTLGLQENYRLGPDMYVRIYPIAQAFGSSRDLLGLSALSSVTAPVGTGLARVYGGATVEALPDTTVSDARVDGGLHIVSPSFVAGRLIYDGALIYRPKNFLNARNSLGGEGRLRGYPSQSFIGKDVIASNLEFRSRPLQLWTFQLAGALFYDVGDAFDGFDELRPKQGAGFGLRALFPQIGRAVMRLDWGFALTPEASSGSIIEGLVFTFKQAFNTPSLSGGQVGH